MKLQRWFVGPSIWAALLVLALAMPLDAQTRGCAPNRLQQVGEVGKPLLASAKALPGQASASVVNAEADYLTTAFWDAPPAPLARTQVTWQSDWRVNDRQGDTRLKSTWLLGKWNPDQDATGSDHFYFRFDLKRVVTSAPEFTSQGHLGDALCAKMKDGGLLSDKATIKLKLDVYFDKPDYKPGNFDEVHLHDQLYDVVVLDFNGVPLNIRFPGVKFGRFAPTFPPLTVPISALRFPVKGDLVPMPAWNVVHIKLVPPKVRSPEQNLIAGGYGMIPATFIGYNYAMDAELSFGAVAPIFLVHGTNADPRTWNNPDPTAMNIDLGLPDIPAFASSFNQFFSTFPGICFNDIALLPNGPIWANGGQLEGQIAAHLACVGAKACHIIAHSKGGIDSRSMISAHYDISFKNTQLFEPEHFEVLSIYTLNTPHRGTVLSDISWNRLHKSNPFVDPQWKDLQTLMTWDRAFLHDPSYPDGLADAPTGSALEAQMIGRMQDWNKRYPFSQTNTGGRPIRFYNTASDADWNVRNRIIDSREIEFSPYAVNFGVTIDLNIPASSAYRTLYWARQVDTREGKRTLVLDENVIEIPVTELFVPNNQIGAEWNDLVVSISSAKFVGGTLFCPPELQNSNGILLKNHSSVKTFGLAKGIVAQIKLDWPVNGQ